MPQSTRPIDVARGIAFDPANTGLAAAQVQDAIDALNAIVAQGANATAQGTWLISGGGVAWVSGYQYRVSAAQYYIAGIAHTAPQATVTLDPPDAAFSRFDVVAVDDAGAVVVLEGTPSAAPELPDVDPQRQLTLTIVRVDVGTSEPPAPPAAARTIYAENAGPPGEWTLAASAGTITLGSTSNPHGGTRCIEATGAANGTYLEATTAPAIVVTESQDLVFHVRCKAGWPGQKSLSASFRTAAAAVGNAVAVANGFFGFSTANVATYQQVVIPIAQFNLPAGTTATKLRVAVVGGGASVGFHIDDIALQGGVTDPGTGATGITQQQADARYAQRSANLSDLVAAATARANLDVSATFRFGASGTITTGQKTPTHRVRAAGTAFFLEMTLSAGTATAAIEASTDGGTTWPATVGTVAIASGKANTAAISAALAAGTLLRVNYTAAAAAADPVVTLHVR